MLHSVGPEDMREDEHVIGRGYVLGASSILFLIPLGVAYFADVKWVVAAGFVVALPMLNEVGGRLHDLCIRLRRTNVLISSQNSKEWLKLRPAYFSLMRGSKAAFLEASAWSLAV